MLFLAGVIGGKVRKSAMETVKMSFGQKGSSSVCSVKCVAACGLDGDYDFMMEHWQQMVS